MEKVKVVALVAFYLLLVIMHAFFFRTTHLAKHLNQSVCDIISLHIIIGIIRMVHKNSLLTILTISIFQQYQRVR